MKRILYVSHDGSAQGGATLAMIELIDQLDKEKYHPIVLYPSDEGIKKILEEKRIESIEFKFWWWCYSKSNKNNFKKYIVTGLKQIITLIMLPMLYSKLKQIKFDLVHTNSSVINIGIYIALMFRKPHIWHVREFGEEHLNLQFLYGTKMTRKIMEKYSDYIVCTSKAIFNKYNFILRNSKKTLVIYDGVKIKEKIKEKENKINRYVILISGRVEKGKAQMELIKAVKKIEKDVLVVVAGKFSKNSYYYKEIQNYIITNNLQKKVSFIGYCKEMQSVRTYANLEIVCSRHEGFGLVTVEAMMAKLPVIASRSGATPEIIKEGETGLLYNPGNIEELAMKIEYLIKNPNIAKNMGECGYKRAIKQFNIEKHASKIEKLYDHILDDKENYNQ